MDDVHAAEPADVTAEAVREQLTLILASSTFSSAPRSSRLLRYLVEHSLSGAPADVKEIALGIEVFDRGPSFDPRMNTIVRVHARRLRERLATYYAGEGRLDLLLIQIPKGHYRAVFFRRPTSEPVPDGTRIHPPVLAVLPFDDLSENSDLRYFSDGVSEEILQRVARTTGLRVIGRSSSFQFRGANKAVARVAEALGCTHVLDGSVRRSGARTRVSAQLIECARQLTLWSDTFDRMLSDVFALQDEISAAIARALESAFAPMPAWQPVDPEAHDLYLQARGSGVQWLECGDAELMERAVTRAPDFAQAWAALAVARAIESNLEPDPERSARSRARAIEAGNAALSLDSAAGAAYAALSIVEPICGRFLEREALIGKALALSPNDPIVLFWASRWSWAVGRMQDALGYMTRAQTVDPLWPQGVHQFATALKLAGLSSEAERVWDQAISRWPGLPYLYNAQLRLEIIARNWPRVEKLMQAAAAAGIETTMSARLRKQARTVRDWSREDTEALRRKLEAELAETGTLRLDLQFACEVGLTDQVYRLLERADFAPLFEPAGRLREHDFLHHLFAPVGERRMQRDPRFARLCGRLGLCEYWVRSGRWPDCADELQTFYDFRAEARRYLTCQTMFAADQPKDAAPRLR